MENTLQLQILKNNQRESTSWSVFSQLHNTFPSTKVFSFYIIPLLMFRSPNKTTINKDKTTNLYWSTSFRFSFIFRYFKVFQVKRIIYIQIFQVSQMFTCGLSDLLLLAVGSLVVFVLREYINYARSEILVSRLVYNDNLLF